MITSYFVVDDFMQVHTPIKSRRKLEKYSICHNFINISEKPGLYFEINLNFFILSVNLEIDYIIYRVIPIVA